MYSFNQTILSFQVIYSRIHRGFGHGNVVKSPGPPLVNMSLNPVGLKVILKASFRKKRHVKKRANNVMLNNEYLHYGQKEAG